MRAVRSPSQRSAVVAITTLATVVTLCVSAAASQTSATQPGVTNRPNILVIMTDQQHAGMLSCAGNPYVKTPALDALAAAGTRFERAYVSNPVCVPSRFSIQTGKMPSTIGMRSNEGRLNVPPDLCSQSLGPLLKRAGYRCAYGGKHHFPRDLEAAVMGPAYEKLTDDARDDLARLCERFLKGKHDRPFLLFASFINPHDICHMAINAFARSEGRTPGRSPDTQNCERTLDRARQSGDLDSFIREHCPPLPANFGIPTLEPESIELDYVKTVPFRQFAREKWSEQTWRLHRWLYGRLTEQADAQIGIVLQALKDADLEQSTLVIFTSDHGDMDASHRLEHKSVLYEEAVRVPLLVAWKGTLPTGRVDSTHLISTGLDLLPTLGDYAKADVPKGLAGSSLRPLLENAAAARWRDHVVVESQNGRMVRTDEFKYSVYEHGANREMLIDLNRDPGEMDNLADRADYKADLDRHRALLLQWVRRWHDRIAPAYMVDR